MRDAAHHVGPQANRFLHQLAAIAKRLDPLLGKGDDLQVHQVPGLFAHLEHGLERGQVGVGDIDMGTHLLDAMGGQGAQGLVGPGASVFGGDAGLALTPALDALEQRAAHVPAWLAGGEGGVQVDMWLDERRYHQVAAGIQVLLAMGRHRGLLFLGQDAGDAPVFQVQLVQAFTVAQAGVGDQHRGGSSGRRSERLPPDPGLGPAVMFWMGP